MTPAFSDFVARLRDGLFIHASPASDPPGAVPPEVGVFETLALELFSLQFAHNAAYRQLCLARDATPGTVERWTQIPAAPTPAFKEFEMSCLPESDRPIVFHSSGTTHYTPSRHFHNALSLQIYDDSLWQWFAPHLLAVDLDLELLALTPRPADVPHSSLAHMFETVRQRLDAPIRSFVGKPGHDGSWTLDLEAAGRALDAATQAQLPVLILGTAFSFVHLLDGLAAQNLRYALAPGSRVMETGGYKGRSRSLSKTQLHRLIAERLGISPGSIVCEYGMSELSSQAYDRVAGDRAPKTGSPTFQFPPWARARVVSPETGMEVAVGETGLLHICDLANVFSVMAVQTEDLAVRGLRGFEWAGRVAPAEPRGCSLMAT